MTLSHTHPSVGILIGSEEEFSEGVSMRAVIAEMPKHWLEERSRSEIGQRDEMWEGVLHMPPMPNRMHQVFVRDLLIYTSRGRK